METNIELLKDLIEISDLVPQEKLNTIVQTLLKTDDIIKARMLSEKIISGDFSSLKESAIENLVDAFSKLNAKGTDKIEITEDEDEDEGKDNKTQNLEYELRSLKLKMESIEHNSEKRLKELEKKNKELEEKNSKLISILELTKNSELIEVSDEDINELYIKHLESGETTHNNAFILNDTIPKAYYKVK
ncbi:hypothetical protein G9F71_008525 [Clostridium sp. FP2]|uniref:hypothetical protein n=1 Tax=Clostridium sp. FP2 TaxID=2724481 RepID=UPI0013E9220F|nr:hypothetical protein [Clostridium sp. FP2]MBZ9622897.1 hypothetical protein [Clostridium sp. FP2]